MKIIRLITYSAVLLAFLGGAVACKSSPPLTITEHTAINTIRAYADPATEMTLQGLSENDLVKYTQYGNSEFKAAVTQEIFDETVIQTSVQLGTYISKELLSIEEQDGYAIVHYKAKYLKNEADLSAEYANESISPSSVGIKMVFDKDQLVASQWFE